ncbi:MAG: rod-binding protein [Armatimonadota bacterium]
MRVQGTGLLLPDADSAKIVKASDADSRDQKKLKQACKDFESIFLGYLLKSMRKTVSKSELLGSSQEEQVFQDMMDDEVSKSAAENNTVGIADALYKQLSAQITK